MRSANPSGLREDCSIGTSETLRTECAGWILNANIVDRTFGGRVGVVLARILVVTREACLGMIVDVDKNIHLPGCRVAIQRRGA